MKKTTYIILSLILFACGSTKKAVEDSETNKPKVETTIKVKPEEIKTEIEEVNEVIMESTDVEEPKATITESKIPLPPKPPKPSNNKELTIHTRWNTILQTNVSVDGNVNYSAIRKQRNELNIYIDSLQENLPSDDWSKDEKLVYWINAYNALTIDLILRNYPIKSIKDIDKPWDQRLWKFGKKWINLNQIEHEILRKMDEPRIHFAIVCASFSCPKLQNTAFTIDNLEEQLTIATKTFLTDEKRNNITANDLRLSKIFKWFKKDFEKNGTLIDFLNTYSEIEISAKAKKSFKVYNWNLNN